jgi:hypothetical protein
MANDFYRQLGTGVSSLTFGVALAIFIYSVSSGIVNGIQTWLLFGTSFLLMLRFWWRYSELFVQHLPSKTFWHFLFDFLVSFFGILAVLTVGNMQTWALLGMLAMVTSAIRCYLSWNSASKDTLSKLKQTFFGSAGMFVIFGAIYSLANVYSQMTLSAAVFLVVLIFIVYSSRKP